MNLTIRLLWAKPVIILMILLSCRSFTVYAVTAYSKDLLLAEHAKSLAAESIGFSPSNSIPTNTPTNNTPNINQADKSADDLFMLKRKVEIEKAQAELNKMHGINGADSANDSSLWLGGAQTTVSGVAINQDGRKIAWLQFADGGVLTVDIGTRLDDYVVTDITMNGVMLTAVTVRGKNKKRILPHKIFLKRIYFADNKAKAQSSISQVFKPSPILTGANTMDNPYVVNKDGGVNSGEMIVPPIIENNRK